MLSTLCALSHFYLRLSRYQKTKTVIVDFAPNFWRALFHNKHALLWLNRLAFIAATKHYSFVQP